MSLFKRRKGAKNGAEDATQSSAAPLKDAGKTISATEGSEAQKAQLEQVEEDTVPAIPLENAGEDEAQRTTKGPWDAAENAPDVGERIDLGALRIPGIHDLTLRLEVDEAENRVTAVNLALGESSVQLQVFAAPKTEGIWDDIREELLSQIQRSGGAADEVPGHFGREVLARIPARMPDGRTGHQVARFAGVDGPRWFLRAVFSGPAAHDEGAAQALEDLIRGTIVDRGDEARPPRDLLDLRMPQAVEPQAPPTPAGAPDLGSLGRGPEITQIG